MGDKELIRRIQSGQKEYLNEIASRYYDDIYYFCAYQTGSREDAYDLAQETFLKFIRYVDGYRHQNLKGYLLTIAMNLCRTYFYETGKKQTERPRQEAEKGESQNRGMSQMGELEQSRILADSLFSLPDAQREAVILHYFYGYKNREIARMTGASCAAVKSRIHQGLDKLKKMLEKEDFYE